MTSEFGVAVHALVFLNHKGRSLSSEELAENICTHPARVRKVMAKLKRAGFVSTKEGVDGGYLLTADPKAVSLRRVAEAVEAEFVSAAWRSGDTDMECLVASGMADIMDGIYGKLNRLCLERLETITIFTIDRMIFGEPSNLKEEE